MYRYSYTRCYCTAFISIKENNMPVTPREISERGYYHLILRGNGKQIIFEDHADYIHFLDNLKQYSEEHKIAVNAYCLMENHVHLLVCAGNQNISMFMKRLAGNYALWFNRKYKRTGHLFERRYISVPIESEDRLTKSSKAEVSRQTPP